MSRSNGPTWRTYVTPLVAITFAAVAATGLLMLFHFRGGNLRGLHETAGILFAVAGLIHVVINWRAFLTCFRWPVALIPLGAVTSLSLAILLTPPGEAMGEREALPFPVPDFRPDTAASGGEFGASSSELVAAFMEFDENGDGALSVTEVPERMQGIFERGNTDGDAVLTREEITEMVDAQVATTTEPRRGGRDGWRGRRRGL